MLDLRNRFDETAIEQDVALRRDDQIRRHVRRADVVNVSNDAKRFDRLVPGAALRVSLCVGRCRTQQDQEKRDDAVTKRRHAAQHTRDIWGLTIEAPTPRPNVSIKVAIFRRVRLMVYSLDGVRTNLFRFLAS